MTDPVPAPLPLSKPADLTGDAAALAPFTAQVDAHPAALEGQHPIRRWEYAMALYAIQEWQRGVGKAGPLIADVGGAGSQFWQLLTAVTRERIVSIDPANVPTSAEAYTHPYVGTVEEYAVDNYHGQFDVLSCISVIEHVVDLRPFFRACHMLLKPGGLLFLTTDYWDADGPDVAHFHWMRHRIYNAERIRRLVCTLRELGFASLGKANWNYPGNQLYDYSVASLAVTRKGL